MALLTWFSFTQWFDNNGDALASGKIYTYEAGTSTMKTTYTDGTGSSAHTNPIILDAGGRAQIWLSSGAYKFIIKTSADETIETIDNIIGSPFGSNIGFLNNISELRAISPGAYNTVYINGYADEGDGGQGHFYWSSTSTANDDTGTIIIPNSLPSAGRWLRSVTDGKYYPEMFLSSVFFLTWCDAQTTNRSVILNNDLDLNGADIDLNQYIDLAEFNDGAQIKNGTITISKMSAFPQYQIFNASATVDFVENATRQANLAWFGSGAPALALLVSAFPSGNIQFVDETVTEQRQKLKYIGTNGTIYDYALYNPNESRL